MPSLRDKTISGIFWSFLQKVGSRGISFVVMILLARLLTPKDFGLIGMLTIFIQISQSLVNGGFKFALIQKKDADEKDFSSVFWINLIVSTTLYLLIFLSAPLIADFYNQPILTQLVRILSLIVIINAFSIVQETRLVKNIRFRTLMMVHLPSTLFDGIIGVTLAYLNFGVWSLIFYQLINRLAFAVQIWIYAKWKPLFSFDRHKVSKLFSFGGRLMISGIVTKIYNNIFLVIIGKFYPVSSVGYYQNSFNLVSTPSGTLTEVLKNVS